MKRILVALMITIFTITACAPNMDEPISSKTPSVPNLDEPVFSETPVAPNLDEPVSSETPSAPQTGGFIPSPADSNLMRGNVYLDSTELLSMESYPLQLALVLKGSLPTPCHQLRVSVSPPDLQNKIVVDVYSVADPNTICAQMLAPFEVNFPLGSYPTGHYTVWVNGKQVTEFNS